MFKNYLKLALRNISRQKTYSLINIAGLAIGLTCFILIMLYIKYEFSYESHHENAENIYRVNMVHEHPNGKNKLSFCMVPVGPAVTEELPEIIDYARFMNFGRSLVKYEDKTFYENKIFCVDPGILNMFTLPVVMGTVENALSEKFSVVITEEISEKYFGKENPIGKSFYFDDDKNPVTITAVIKDFPRNTNIQADIMMSFSTLREYVGDSWFNNWITTNLATYVLLNDNIDITNVQDKMKNILNTHSKTEINRSFELDQLTRIHLYSDVTSTGNIQNIYIFLGIGILILIIASINFMNLSTARSMKRASEVGVRKVVGASHFNLISQFLSESILISFLALLLSLIIVDLLLPFFANLTQQDLIIPSITNWKFYGFLGIITLIVGLVSGSYPALYLSSFSPARVLKQKFNSSGKGVNFRQILVIAQFSIAIALIISTLSINSQIKYMSNKNLGFQKDQIVIVPINGGELRKDIEPFKQTLSTNPNIISSTGSVLLPSKIGMYNNVTWEGARENETVALIQNKVDYDFLKTYEIELVKGRDFSKNFPMDLLNYQRENIVGAVLLNEKAVEKFGWDDPIGKHVIQVYGDNIWRLNVVGVFKDFHFSSLRNEIQPLSLFLLPPNPSRISIKIQSNDVENTIAFIEDTWKQHNPGIPFEYYFLDTTFENTYRAEKNLQKLFSYFSILSIFISCLGLFGLASFAAEQRTKEIGVRKVLGASVPNLCSLLSREFTKWVLISNIIAMPMAWFYMNSWLSNFPYRTSLNPWTFIFAGILAFIIALLTVSTHAIKAAVKNPIDALRYE